MRSTTLLIAMTKCTVRSPTCCGASESNSRWGGPEATPATIIQGGWTTGGRQTWAGCGIAGGVGAALGGTTGGSGGGAAAGGGPTGAVGSPAGGVTAGVGTVGVVWW